jgi:putative ABC transport system permease protein
MLRLLRTLLAVVPAALRRLQANLGLALCALIALVATVALCVSIPLYAEGASLRLLQNEIEQQEQQEGRSPFALLFRYVGAWNGPLEWERVQLADAYISGPGLAALGLPLDGLARHARTGQLRLFLPADTESDNQFLKDVTLGFVDGLDSQMRIVAGTRPAPAAAPLTQEGAPVEVMIMRALADQVGINVGDEFALVLPDGGDVGSLPLRVTALWEPLNPADPAWFFPPQAFQDVLLVPEATYTGPLADVLTDEVDQVLWFARLSGTHLTAAEATPLLQRVEAVRAQAAGAVPGLRLEQSPEEALSRYRRDVASLTRQLFVFSVPIVGLVLYFAALVASMLVNRQRGEIALLKTRGVRNGQILGVYVVEWLLLGALALAIGPLLGIGFARLMGSTRSFLQLALNAPPLNVALTWGSLQYGVLAVALAIVAVLLPALAASRRTLVDEQQQAARTLRPPFWQRFYLDVLLLLPPLYGLYQLQSSGGLWQGAAQSTDPFSNPLLILVPVLLCFALGLLAVRLVPLLLGGLARLATRPTWTAPLVALRALARQPGSYRGPLLLLILTLSLAAFSASMAATLDGALETAITYQVGAETQLIEAGQSTEQPQQSAQPGAAPQELERKNIEEEARFLFVPVDDHLQVDGIEAVARVGRYDASLQVGGTTRQAQLVGIDRLDFPDVVTHFAPTWADGQSLGALMNLLARTPGGIIVSRNMLGDGLTVGDTVSAQLSLYGDRREVQFVILAAVELWPGFYPQDGPLMIANLNYIFDQMGGQYPYDVWIDRAEQADLDALVAGVRGMGINVVTTRDAAQMITEEQIRPQRQGLFGLLSVGFVAAGAITLLGFLLAALINARRRAIELGVLGALGMSGGQVALALIIEQVVLVAAGIGAGTGIGLLAATLVVPLLQVGAGPYPGTPAYPPQIAWDQVTLIYIVFAVALLLTLLALAWILGRMRLFQAVKLGDVN